MEDCTHLGQVVSIQQRSNQMVKVHQCNYFNKSCTVEDHGILVPGGAMNVCVGCPKRNAITEEPKPLSTPPKTMSLFERAMEMARVMANTAVTGMADESLIKARLEICSTCPQFVDNQCKVCGCKVVREKNLVNKLAHISSVCADRANPRW